jgi:hypothetical protein
MQLRSGERRFEPIIYIDDWPRAQRGAPMHLFEPAASVCVFCASELVDEIDPAGYGVMFTCMGGCGQRYWLDEDDTQAAA